MSRPKILSDQSVLDHALSLMHRDGPDSLTFASLASVSGLSGATLVQRFGTKAGLRQRALLHAWDRLEERTAQLIAEMERTPDGARALLVALSREHGDSAAYAQGLLLLREDLRDPALRARGAAWKQTLNDALDACFAGSPGAGGQAGALMAVHWQGALLWWAFDPRQPVHEAVDAALRRLQSALLS